uniref:Uncharacterized protein n=1 Tax=Arion vulgaris TaxID=1028688 RepID=A0A0B7AKN1_9EUPU
MVSMKLAVLLIVTAVVAFVSSAVVDTSNNVVKEKTLQDDLDQIRTPFIPDFTDDEDDVGGVSDDDNAEIDGIPLRLLTEEERENLLDEEDTIFAAKLDILVSQKIVKSREDGSTVANDNDINLISPGGRQRRWIPVAIRLFSAGRALLKGAVRAPKPTFSGSRVTQQYVKPGNYGTATRDFNRFKPDGVTNFSKNGISGSTGTVGKHRITVRDGSKQGSPTLEIRSPKGNGENVRKFRYGQN